jgi:hypothetical protein
MYRYIYIYLFTVMYIWMQSPPTVLTVTYLSHNPTLDTGKKEDQEKDEDECEQDYMSISSDDDKPKVVYVQGGPKGKAKAAPKKAAKPDLTEEELKTLKEENAKVNKLCKKVQTMLEPVLKQCNKPSKAPAAPKSFHDQIWAAKEIVKGAKKIQEKYKGRTWEALTFDHTFEVAKDLKESFLKGCKCIDSLESMMNGGFDEELIKSMADSASEKRKEIQKRADKAEDVS